MSDCNDPKKKSRSNLIAGALLGWNGSDKLVAIGTKGITALTEGAPAPGVKSWVLTLDESIRPLPNQLFSLAVVSEVATPFFQPRFHPIALSPLTLEIYLVDGAGTPIDPATTFAVAPGVNGVSFFVVRGGNRSFM